MHGAHRHHRAARLARSSAPRSPRARRCLGWLCAPAICLASLPLRAAAEERWLVLEVDVAAPSAAAAGIVRETERALRARGLAVVESQSAARLFEHEHSRAPYDAAPAEVEALDALLRRLDEQLAAQNSTGVRATLAELADMPVDKQDLLNHDMRRARRRFHACISAAYLLDRAGQAAPAQDQLSACARDFPGFDPELPGVAADAARDFLARAQAALAALAPSTLRVDVTGVASDVRCYVRVNGMDRGAAPVSLEKFRLPHVRVQVDCGKRPGRVYEVSLSGPQATLRVDASLDAAVESRATLKLSYADAATADALRVKHALILAQAVRASQVLQVFQGKLRRIDVASGRELVSDAAADPTQVASALDFVLSNGQQAAQPRPEPRLASRAADAAAAPARSHGESSSIAEPARHERPARVFRTLAYVSAGLTLAAAATAIVGWRMHEGHVDKFNARAECTDAEPDALTPACQRELDSADSASSILLVGAIAGGASLVMTGVFFILDANRPREHEGFACAAGPGQLGVACQLSF
jgi:hypothetical protein